MPSPWPPKGPGKTRLEPFFSSWNETLRIASQQCLGDGGLPCLVPRQQLLANTGPSLGLPTSSHTDLGPGC